MTVLFSDGNIYLRKPETESLRGKEGVRQAARGEAILNEMLPRFPSYPVQALPSHLSSLASTQQMGTHGRLLGEALLHGWQALASGEFLPPCLAFKTWAGFSGCRCWSVFPPASGYFFPSCLLGVPVATCVPPAVLGSADPSLSSSWLLCRPPEPPASSLCCRPRGLSLHAWGLNLETSTCSS